LIAQVLPLEQLRKPKANAARLRTMILPVLIAGIAIVFAFWLWVQNTPALLLPELSSPGAGVYMFDRYDHLIDRLNGDENTVPVTLSNISPNMQTAILAAEDHRFYSHHGIDLYGLARALVADIHSGRPLEGASTITEQMVKNVYFKGASRTPLQKCKELIAATLIEMRYSKKKILETYLNEIYFGNGAYGIERAAQIYFGKDPSELSLAECAFLSGLVKAPSELGSPEHRQQAIDRQHEILDNMVAYGYIKEDQAQAATGRLMRFKKGECTLKYPYYVSYVMQILKARYGDKGIWAQGLRVYTNLDPAAQADAERTLAQQIKKAPAGVSQGALVSIAVPDGAVIALAGGVGDFWTHQWNRATNPHTAGSAFKPFVYLAALNNNVLNSNSVIDDSPLTVSASDGTSYSPRDFDSQYLGPISVRKALALSRNICAVRVAQAVGIPNVITVAQQAGISSKLDNNLSLALGSSAVSPLELAGAYSTLARDGVAIQPNVLRRIDDPKGKTLATFTPRPTSAFAGEPVAELVDALQDVVKNGTGKAAQLLNRPVAGKTGTSDQSKDTWFVGFTPDLVTAVWCGNDENRRIPGSRVTGGTIAARLWHNYMTDYYQSHPTPPGIFAPPSNPLAPENDFSAEPTHSVVNGLDSPSRGHTADKGDQDKPGLLRRIFHHVLNWF
jgi:penicillin-binding protein 1A